MLRREASIKRRIDSTVWGFSLSLSLGVASLAVFGCGGAETKGLDTGGGSTEGAGTGSQKQGTGALSEGATTKGLDMGASSQDGAGTSSGPGSGSGSGPGTGSGTGSGSGTQNKGEGTPSEGVTTTKGGTTGLDTRSDTGSNTGGPTSASVSDTSTGPSTGDSGSGSGGEAKWFRPTPAMKWQIQLLAPGGTPNIGYDVDVYDVDLFDVSDATIAQLRAKGRRIVCYFSAGSYEKWRPDAAMIPEASRGKKMKGWDELWLDIRNPKVLEVMKARMDKAKQRGCDAVDPDNVDGYANDTGFRLSRADQVAFLRHLSAAAHERDLGIGLKNAVDLIPDVVDDFDFAVNEECYHYKECGKLMPFVMAGKPVWNIEYPDPDNIDEAKALAKKICPSGSAKGFRSLVMPMALDDSFRVDCDESAAGSSRGSR